MRTTGAHATLRMLADAGVEYLFGNPGTTELPLIDALADEPRIRYLLALQEVPVMAIADGYSQASRKLGVVNLHISCGLGNAMGMLYNAHRAGTPLLVTAGQQDRRLRFEEPILWSDMVQVAKPWTKWSVEVERLSDLPSALRRCIRTALTPPTGPVFLSLPIDLQSEVGDLDTTADPPLDTKIRPPTQAIKNAAKILAAAKNPGILAGSRVIEGDAVSQIVQLAEKLGAPAFSESGTTHGRLGFPADHPLYGQGLPLWAPEVREKLHEFDVLFVVGMDLLRLYVYFEPARAIPEHVRIIHLDQDPWQLGKNYPLEVGLLGDLGAGLNDLLGELQSVMTSEQLEAARVRGAARSAAHLQKRRQLEERTETERGRRPITPLTLMSSLARVLPRDVALIEEAVTTTNTYFERLGALHNTTGYFGHRGWALGWGLGCAIGVQLAWPNRPVLALLGEGAAMYGIQGLWTAARYRIPVTFVICNNAQYQILKVGATQLKLPGALRGEFTGMDLNEPEIDFVSLAKSLGVQAFRINDPEELSVRAKEALESNQPIVLEVPIDRTHPKQLNY